MKRQGTRGGGLNQHGIGLSAKRFALVAVSLLIVSGLSGHAAPLLTLDNPTAFFTNVAARLLRSELSLDLNNIQVYPTNQYTPAVHRLLQVTANIYDAATNRTYGIPTATNGFPTVFRPIFRQTQSGTNTIVVIAGYREVLGTAMANPVAAPAMLDLNPGNLKAVPYLGVPFVFTTDRQEPMVWGIPLVIGARLGFPNFNEFAMQPAFFISRLLEFRRAPGNVTGPIVQTNQMHVMAISNIFGLEAWNSYSNPYPRNLQLVASATMTETMTNELGSLILTNSVSSGLITNLVAGTWQGWIYPSGAASSFILPWGSGNPFTFLTNSTYIDQPPWFQPQTRIFMNSASNTFYVPRWWLNLKAQVLFILVDTGANRIVDYVNLKNSQPTLDITAKLMEGAQCTGMPSANINPAEQWCTNRTQNSPDPLAPPIGIINQIGVGLGLNGATLPDINSFTMDPYAGLDAESAIDGFRYNLMGLSPIFPKDQGKTFYKSNVFYVPFDPYRPIYMHVSWQANDPLVHFTISDLCNLSIAPSNIVDFISHNPPLDNIGIINSRYQPWGGNPYAIDKTLDYQLAVKDSFVLRSDSWDFPTGTGLDLGWVGRVHRGTPWQTVFLKSTNILAETPTLPLNLMAWQRWTGNAVMAPDISGAGGSVPDALFTVPTNDWHLVSLLAPLFGTNDLRTLASVNQKRGSSWLSLLNGITVLTDTGAGQLQPVQMSASSPQAATIAAALDANRATQALGLFDSIGSILATPELSIASPWLNSTNRNLIVSDEALEMVPSQLLPRLRPDSIGSMVPAGSGVQIQFTGVDDYLYAVQVSSNLVDWTTVITNYPQNGLLGFEELGTSNGYKRFYRTSLLP